jgi:GNAT superfamily N-acetyltransferase
MIQIEPFNYKKHYLELAPLVAKYYREVNQENLEEEIPWKVGEQYTSVKKLDLKLQNLVYEGMFCKVAFDQDLDEMMGFVWYREAFRGLIIGIDALWVKKAYRKTGAGREIMNSFCNDFNKGEFEIYAQVHEKNLPQMMLDSFKNWERVRSCNDRDLMLIRGTYDKKLQNKGGECVSIQHKI